jgi:hypothetical protein
MADLKIGKVYTESTLAALDAALQGFVRATGTEVYKIGNSTYTMQQEFKNDGKGGLEYVGLKCVACKP